MPAQNLPDLLDFEGHFETAAQQILTANGIAAYISEQQVKLPLLNTGIGIDIAPALDALRFLPKPSNWPVDREAPQDFFRYPSMMEFRIEVPRDANGASLPGVDTMLREVRGKIRAAMLMCCAPFNAANLPYYRVSEIRPNGTITGFEAVRNIDFCSIRFAITFAIVDGAWPAWIIS